jgi:hypothetical protein
MAKEISDTKTDLNIDFGLYKGKPLKHQIKKAAKSEVKSTGGWVRDLVRAELARRGLIA